MTKDIRLQLETVPFIPFVVHTADGKEYEVPTPDHAHVHPGANRVSIFTDEGQQYILPALLISGLRLKSI